MKLWEGWSQWHSQGAFVSVLSWNVQLGNSWPDTCCCQLCTVISGRNHWFLIYPLSMLSQLNYFLFIYLFTYLRKFESWQIFKVYFLVLRVLIKFFCITWSCNGCWRLNGDKAVEHRSLHHQLMPRMSANKERCFGKDIKKQRYLHSKCSSLTPVQTAHLGGSLHNAQFLASTTVQCCLVTAVSRRKGASSILISDGFRVQGGASPGLFSQSLAFLRAAASSVVHTEELMFSPAMGITEGSHPDVCRSWKESQWFVLAEDLAVYERSSKKSYRLSIPW